MHVEEIVEKLECIFMINGIDRRLTEPVEYFFDVVRGNSFVVVVVVELLSAVDEVNIALDHGYVSLRNMMANGHGRLLRPSRRDCRTRCWPPE